jgi:mono/diheme cytochrome c family protein
MKPLTASLGLLAILTGGSVGRAEGQEAALGPAEYEGWRQYSAQCARCHGQDALPNPVAANLLVSLAPGGPVAGKAAFTKVVKEGREERGMPGFGETMEPTQIEAVYAYLKGRAEKRIPPGRPKEPAGPDQGGQEG